MTTQTGTTNEATPTDPPSEDLIDEALEESFPASDPPSFTRGGTEDVALDDEPPGRGWLKIAVPVAAGTAAIAGLVFAVKRRRRKRDARATLREAVAR